jgi:hypothetical protein
MTVRPFGQDVPWTSGWFAPKVSVAISVPATPSLPDTPSVPATPAVAGPPDGTDIAAPSSEGAGPAVTAEDPAGSSGPTVRTVPVPTPGAVPAPEPAGDSTVRPAGYHSPYPTVWFNIRDEGSIRCRLT